MPELPEVEVVKRGLEKIIEEYPKIVKWNFRRKDLRFPIPLKQLQGTVGCEIQRIERRSKYLLWPTAHGIILSHLGMTGVWRVLKEGEALQKHDHIVMTLESRDQKQLQLCYSDPRRFGFIDLIEVGKQSLHPRIKDLGPEPEDLDAKLLYQNFQLFQRPIKSVLMDAKVMVGVGNIYASEILFKAKIRPQRKASQISADEVKKIIQCTKSILNKAIRGGGSTISNYQSINGKGRYQNSHFVYGRSGQECLKCGTVVKTEVIAGRSTFWCPNCQD